MELAETKPERVHHNKGKVWGKPFAKGNSGNKKGRPQSAISAAALARSYALDAIELLAKTMRDRRVLPATRVACAEKLLDRGLGKPLQTAAVAVGTLRDVHNLTDQELLAIATGQVVEDSAYDTSGEQAGNAGDEPVTD